MSCDNGNDSPAVAGAERPASDQEEVSEFTFYDLVLLLRSEIRVLVAITGVIAATGIAIAILSTPTFRAEAVLTALPTEAETSPLSSLSASAGALREIAGFGIRETGSIQQNLAVLSSRQLTRRFLDDDMLRVLFADRWDEATGQWSDSTLAARWGRLVSAFWTRLTDDGEDVVPPDSRPSFAEAFRAIDGIRSIRHEAENGLVYVSFQWKDPNLAARWVANYVRTANEYLRDQQLQSSNQRLAFLEEQLAKTNIIEVRDAITSLMEEELKRSMMANVRDEFAFKTIDPAVVPDLRAWPKRKLIATISLVGGLFVGISFIIVRNYFRMMRKSR